MRVSEKWRWVGLLSIPLLLYSTWGFLIWRWNGYWASSSKFTEVDLLLFMCGCGLAVLLKRDHRKSWTMAILGAIVSLRGLPHLILALAEEQPLETFAGGLVFAAGVAMIFVGLRLLTSSR